VTTASLFSSVTFARVTPFTDSSADRTVARQPTQVIPSTLRVTVTERGLGAF
jgi:hypothetical protein